MRISSIFIGLAVAVAFGLMAFSSVNAYYVQTPMPTFNYPYGYATNDQVSQIINGELNFVGSFYFVPQPVPLYFYNPPAPFAYPYSTSVYGYGSSYGYGFSYNGY